MCAKVLQNRLSQAMMLTLETTLTKNKIMNQSSISSVKSIIYSKTNSNSPRLPTKPKMVTERVDNI